MNLSRKQAVTVHDRGLAGVVAVAGDLPGSAMSLTVLLRLDHLRIRDVRRHIMPSYRLLVCSRGSPPRCDAARGLLAAVVARTG